MNAGPTGLIFFKLALHHLLVGTLSPVLPALVLRGIPDLNQTEIGWGFWSFQVCKSRYLLESHLAAHLQCWSPLCCCHFPGRLMSPCFSCRVTCLCAQFEAVLQHGMKRSRGLALTAAAIKQAAGFASKTETGT